MLHDALALSTLVLDACHIVRLFVKGSVVVRQYLDKLLIDVLNEAILNTISICT